MKALHFNKKKNGTQKNNFDNWAKKAITSKQFTKNTTY